MRAPRIYTTEAIVLGVRRLGEADSILTLFSLEHGKFDAVARGVRKTLSRKAGHLEPLTHSSLLLAHGSNLDIVTQAEALHSFLALREDLRRLSAGFYVAELLDRFTVEHDQNPALFRLLLDTLTQLNDGTESERALRYFEANLLVHSGFQPQLSHCVTCLEPLRPVLNYFSVAAGGVVCPTCRPAGAGLPSISVNALKVLRLLIGGAFAGFARLQISDTLMAELESLLRGAVQRQLEREPRSLQFLREVRQPYARGPRPQAAAVIEP